MAPTEPPAALLLELGADNIALGPSTTQVISSLPSEVRSHIADFYDWNWSLIPALEDEITWIVIQQNRNDDYHLRGEIFELIDRLQWWLHLLKTDGNNWRLTDEGERLLNLIQDMNLNSLLDRFAELFDHNRKFFDERPPAFILQDITNWFTVEQ